MRTPVLTFTIKGKPGDGAINRSRGMSRRGDLFKSAKAKSFATRARLAARAAHARAGHPRVRECSVTIRSYWCAELALGDVDAPVRAVLDSLEAAGVLEDDSLVIELTASKSYDKDNPRIQVWIWAEPSQ